MIAICTLSAKLLFVRPVWHVIDQYATIPVQRCDFEMIHLCVASYVVICYQTQQIEFGCLYYLVVVKYAFDGLKQTQK